MAPDVATKHNYCHHKQGKISKEGRIWSASPNNLIAMNLFGVGLHVVFSTIKENFQNVDDFVCQHNSFAVSENGILKYTCSYCSRSDDWVDDNGAYTVKYLAVVLLEIIDALIIANKIRTQLTNNDKPAGLLVNCE